MLHWGLFEVCVAYFGWIWMGVALAGLISTGNLPLLEASDHGLDAILASFSIGGPAVILEVSRHQSRAKGEGVCRLVCRPPRGRSLDVCRYVCPPGRVGRLSVFRAGKISRCMSFRLSAVTLFVYPYCVTEVHRYVLRGTPSENRSRTTISYVI
jgi:hypothetical protein